MVTERYSNSKEPDEMNARPNPTNVELQRHSQACGMRRLIPFEQKHALPTIIHQRGEKDANHLLFLPLPRPLPFLYSLVGIHLRPCLCSNPLWSGSLRLL